MINRNVQLRLEREREKHRERMKQSERISNTFMIQTIQCTYTLTTWANHALDPNCLIPYTVRTQSGFILLTIITLKCISFNNFLTLYIF